MHRSFNIRNGKRTPVTKRNPQGRWAFPPLFRYRSWKHENKKYTGSDSVRLGPGFPGFPRVRLPQALLPQGAPNFPGRSPGSPSIGPGPSGALLRLAGAPTALPASRAAAAPNPPAGPLSSQRPAGDTSSESRPAPHQARPRQPGPARLPLTDRFEKPQSPAASAAQYSSPSLRTAAPQLPPQPAPFVVVGSPGNQQNPR